jgi:GTP cyclohydrolase I
VADAVAHLLDVLGVDLLDDNFIETPRRVANYFLEHFPDRAEVEAELSSYESASFPSTYGGIVLVPNISAYGLCPHHLLPVEYSIHVAYIPNGQAIGLSKLGRIAQQIGSLALLQETATDLIADVLSRSLRTDDVMVQMVGAHLCMRCRGIREPQAETITTTARGRFLRNQDGCKDEFYLMLPRRDR